MSIDGTRAVDKEPLAAVDYLFGMSIANGQRVGPRPVGMQDVAVQVGSAMPLGVVRAYSSVAAMNADTSPAAGTLAYAEGKTYRKTAASGSAGWAVFLDFIPGVQLITAAVTGGTANAVVATAASPVSAIAYKQLVTIGPFGAANTGAMTISINGETARPLVTNTGDPIPAGYIKANMSVLVQIDNTGKYRLFSYGDASAIQAMVENLLLQAQAAAQAAINAASSVIPNMFATKATAAAYSPAVAPEFIAIAGYATAGDGGGALYKKVASQPGHAGKFSITLQNASVVWYEIAEAVLRPEMFGAVGDDAADDTATWQVAALLAAGRRLEGTPGKAYKLTAALSLGDGTHLDLCGARLNFRISGSVRCVVSGNNCCIQNGTIKNFGTTAGIAGDYQCPIAIGKFTENASVSNVRVLNMTIESDWNEGNGIIVTAASHNVLIENIKFPNSSMFCPILAHWGGTSAGTGHPHDIIIRNIECGNINPTGYLISLAAAYNTLVENVKGGTCLYGYHNYAGDYTNMYAAADVKPLVGKSNIARNIIATDVREAGIWVDGQSFNPSLTTPTATPVEMDGIIEKCRFYGVGAIAQTPEPAAQWGAKIANCRDLEIRNNHFEWFQYGIVPAGPTERVHVVANVIRACSSNGVVASFGSSSPLDWVVERNVVQGSNRNGYTTDAGAAILVGNARNAKIIGNRVGFENSDFAFFGVRVTTAAISPVLKDNWVQKLSAGGAAYSIGSVASYDINASGGNNRAGTGVALWGGTTLLNDNGLGFREGIAVEGASPSAGFWNAGDRLWAKVPTSTVVGYVCTAAGSPGTWRAFGT